jgi:hypothetical protein
VVQAHLVNTGYAMGSGRDISLGSVALVAVLSAAVGIWSGLSGPKVADVQVHQAAANLAAASSFVVNVDQTVSEIGTADQAQIDEVVHYQAPDRQWATQTVRSNQSVSVKTITQIGGSCWIHSTGPAPPFTCLRNSFENLLGAVRAFEKPSEITNVAGTYTLSAKDSAAIISPVSGGLTIGMPAVEVRITGAVISWEHISLDTSERGASILIDEVIHFSQVGNGPAVVAPSGPPTETAAS